jgi:hypothetical protein
LIFPTTSAYRGALQSTPSPACLSTSARTILQFKHGIFRRDKVFQLAFIRCPDTPKAGRSIVAIHVDAIQKQDVKVGHVIEK